MHWPETGATHYYEQLRLLDKFRAIKGLLVRFCSEKEEKKVLCPLLVIQVRSSPSQDSSSLEKYLSPRIFFPFPFKTKNVSEMSTSARPLLKVSFFFYF